MNTLTRKGAAFILQWSDYDFLTKRFANKIQNWQKKQKKQTPWFQSAKRTIPTERPSLVGEVSAHFSG
jgi:beta-xylosidase